MSSPTPETSNAPSTRKLPLIIQGGMGMNISNWQLAKSVSKKGQLGLISGTGLSGLLVSQLQTGDVGGHVRRAMKAFPDQDVAEKILAKYYVPEEEADEITRKVPPAYSASPTKALLQLTVVANFVQVFLAKENHDGIVGVNFLEKIQMPHLSSLYGVMLAGVDYVIVGAGLPVDFPDAIEQFCKHEPAVYNLTVKGLEKYETEQVTFDPQSVMNTSHVEIKKPTFLGIVSLENLAIMLDRRTKGRIDGYIVENPLAGGHNAPPRSKHKGGDGMKPVFGVRDWANLEKLRKLGKPFWLAGAYGLPEKIKEALKEGAQGVQIGTPFALCRESGMAQHLKTSLLEEVKHYVEEIYTDAVASPTGFPFKVARLAETLSEKLVYETRKRQCRLGYLREIYRKENGKLGYRCPSEPVEDYLKKGGDETATKGRKCLCEGLAATAGMQIENKDGYVEPPIVTMGKDLSVVRRLIERFGMEYSAEDVIDFLMEHIFGNGLNPSEQPSA